MSLPGFVLPTGDPGGSVVGVASKDFVAENTKCQILQQSNNQKNQIIKSTIYIPSTSLSSAFRLRMNEIRCVNLLRGRLDF